MGFNSSISLFVECAGRFYLSRLAAIWKIHRSLKSMRIPTAMEGTLLPRKNLSFMILADAFYKRIPTTKTARSPSQDYFTNSTSANLKVLL
ncbi:hypothetical protein Pr1d_15570 [Bythopirellula goksoeyrii]|uniref:Uncharacterized protein n=1 Tax=Bythopirellula goksoeyrii TaxID=1400387 RepID=A0A5B9QJK6_9BACT|nr:hypothetical protein Pr1d_15570 [Bythopirellula goksoeyrii]